MPQSTQASADRTAWFQGGDARCLNPGVFPERPWRLVLLGGPGVGKGTQASRLSRLLGACHLSTGDVFRYAKQDSGKEPTPALQEAIHYMEQGSLVPDRTVIEIVRERGCCLSCPKGFLLDGFPRTLTQAQQLDEIMAAAGLSFDAVLNYELDEESLIARLTGRRTCRSCKASFHMTDAPPRQEGVCDHCGGELYQRTDDTIEVIRNRLREYEKQSGPLKAYYAERGMLKTISSEGMPKDTSARTDAVIRELSEQLVDTRG